MKRPILTTTIFIVLVTLFLIACRPTIESQTIVVTEESEPLNQYCETIYSSTFRSIQRCNFEGEICYVAHGPESISIDCLDN